MTDHSSGQIFNSGTIAATKDAAISISLSDQVSMSKVVVRVSVSSAILVQGNAAAGFSVVNRGIVT